MRGSGRTSPGGDAGAVSEGEGSACASASLSSLDGEGGGCGGRARVGACCFFGPVGERDGGRPCPETKSAPTAV